MILIVQELQCFEARLGNFTATPSGHTEKESVQKLVLGAYSFEHFIRCVEKNSSLLTMCMLLC